MLLFEVHRGEPLRNWSSISPICRFLIGVQSALTLFFSPAASLEGPDSLDVLYVGCMDCHRHSLAVIKSLAQFHGQVILGVTAA